MLRSLWNRVRTMTAKRGAAASRRPRAHKRDGYEAGTVGDRLHNDWQAAILTADQYTLANLKTLRGRSREQYANNPYARRFVSLVRTNVVGADGVQFQSGLVDLDSKPRELENMAIEEAWKRWGRNAAFCDSRGAMAWPEMQRLIVGTVAIDGECLIRIHRGTTEGPFGFTLQLLDSELLDLNKNETLESGNYVRFGIEFDRRERPVAYHLLRPTEYAASAWVGYQQLRTDRVPAEDIIHLYMHERVGQHRGVPWMATALTRLRALDKFEEAALVNARVGAAKMGFLHSGEGDEYTGTEKDATTGEVITDVEPGILEQLPQGIQFTGWNPTYPHEMYDPFVRRNLQAVASGLLTSYATFANDLTDVNYSSIRAGTIDERETWKSEQDWFAFGLCQPVFAAWLPMAILTGQVRTITGSFDATLIDDAVESSMWQGRRWPWVDPEKDTNAAIAQMDARLKSRASFMRDQGDDAEETWTQIAYEKRRLAELDIAPAGNSAPSPPDPQPDPAPDKEPDDEPADVEGDDE